MKELPLFKFKKHLAWRQGFNLVELAFGYETTFGSNTPEAYERLILDALNGDGTLFIRGDEAETSWSLLSPVLDFWQDQGKK